MAARNEVRFSGDEADLLKSYNKLLDKQKTMEEKLKSVSKHTKDAKTNSDSYLTSFGSKLAGTIAGIASLSAALATAKQGLADFRAEKELGAQNVMSNIGGTMRLAQVARGDTQMERNADFQNLVMEARKSSAESGMSIQEGENLQFALRSAELDKYRGLFASLYGRVGNVLSLAEGASKVFEGFGEKESGDIKGIVNKLLEGAKSSPLDVSKLAEAVTTVSASARDIKASDEETMAVLAETAKVTKSGDIAATQAKAFGDAIKRLGLSGTGFLGAAQKISEKGMTQDALIKYLGSSEAAAAYGNILQMRGNIVSSQQNITGAQAGGNVESLIATPLSDPVLRAAISKSKNDAMVAIEQMGDSQRQLAEETVSAFTRNEIRKSGSIYDNIMRRLDLKIEETLSGFGINRGLGSFMRAGAVNNAMMQAAKDYELSGAQNDPELLLNLYKKYNSVGDNRFSNKAEADRILSLGTTYGQASSIANQRRKEMESQGIVVTPDMFLSLLDEERKRTETFDESTTKLDRFTDSLDSFIRMFSGVLADTIKQAAPSRNSSRE